MVGHMAWVIVRPSLTAIEVAWRWLIGVPLLGICYIEAQKIIAVIPPESTGLNTINWQNPWTASLKIAESWITYQPHIASVLRWLATIAALAWVVVSGVGRSLVLKRMEPGLPLRLFSMICLQAAWLAVLALTGWWWWASLSWAAQWHINAIGEPDLIGYTIWAVFLSLGFFTLWAFISWIVTIAPMLVLLEGRSALSSLGASLRLGKGLTGKLVEINLVMGIVKLMLIVLAMVFSAVLIPFSEEVGVSTLHIEWMIVTVCYFIASDYFQVVRLKGFIEFWRLYRGNSAS